MRGAAPPRAGTQARLRRILRLLEKAYGERRWHRHRGALDELVATVLSQNTNDPNSHRAFRELKKRFRNWEALAGERPSRIASAIRVAGLSRVKAVRIKEILRRIHAERQEHSLEFLAAMAPEDAMAYLMRLPGVGMKTAACVLLFSFGMPAFPVDTHIYRVSRRLGLVGSHLDREKAQALLQCLVPADAVYPLHLLLIELGRRVCRARRPMHRACPLKDLCPSAE